MLLEYFKHNAESLKRYRQLGNLDCINVLKAVEVLLFLWPFTSEVRWSHLREHQPHGIAIELRNQIIGVCRCPDGRPLDRDNHLFWRCCVWSLIGHSGTSLRLKLLATIYSTIAKRWCQAFGNPTPRSQAVQCGFSGQSPILDPLAGGIHARHLAAMALVDTLHFWRSRHRLCHPNSQIRLFQRATRRSRATHTPCGAGGRAACSPRRSW